MRNFIIDSSVFVLPPVSADLETEKENLCLFYANIVRLKELQRNNAVTISYMNQIFARLRINKYTYIGAKEELKKRTEELLKKAPQYAADIAFHGNYGVFDDWFDLVYHKIAPKRDNAGNLRKGRIGIFENIPDRDNDPSSDYFHKTTFTGASNYYPALRPDFKKTFTLYCGYIADLNQKYFCHDNNFIVLGEKHGIQKTNSLNITLNTIGGNTNGSNTGGTAVKSQVLTVGVQNTKTLCPVGVENFKNLTDACEKAQKAQKQKKKSENLDFGKEINYANQMKVHSLTGTTQKVYHYLETLYLLADIITNKNIIVSDEKTMIEFLNSYGLLCSTDGEIYTKNKCKHRMFEDKSGKKVFFNFHLKPTTDSIKYELATRNTVRIYLCWDNNKILIGWIGLHPLFCGDCGIVRCPANPKH